MIADTLVEIHLNPFSETKVAEKVDWHPGRTPPERGQSFWETQVLENFIEKDWYLNFRMPKEAFNKVCDELRQPVNTQPTKMLAPVPLEKRVALT
uniref:Uncharacterized protein n=1 Tax=Knipowitschia caucasica TaxID=637954 RepID=A0AAV2LQZ5_KNICA